MGRKKIEIVKGFKATDKDLKCRNFQYKIGKEYKEDEAELCSKGFHFCENPLDILNYYDLCDCRMFEVEAKEVSEEVSEENTKRVSKRIKLTAELSLSKFINISFNYLKEQCSLDDNNNGRISDSGNASQVATSGDYSQVATSGYSSRVATSGNASRVATSGDYSRVATSGYSSQVATSGNASQVATSGDYSQVATSGNASQVATSGYSSRVATSGNASRVATSGDYSRVALNGEYSVGMCASYGCKIKGKKGNWITLAEWKFNDEVGRYIPICVKSAQIDGKMIKEDTYYKLENGKFVEVEQ